MDVTNCLLPSLSSQSSPSRVWVICWVPHRLSLLLAERMALPRCEVSCCLSQQMADADWNQVLLGLLVQRLAAQQMDQALLLQGWQGAAAVAR